MPTLKSGNGKLENGSSVAQKPSSLRATMNRAAAIIGIIGATIATDAKAQQAAGLIPAKAPDLGTISMPDEWLWLTSEQIISTLKTNRDILNKKYPSLKDEANWLRVVGAIAAEAAKKETMDYLAIAFDKNSPEFKQLTWFGIQLSQAANTLLTREWKTTQVEKEKSHPIGETKEQKNKRIAIEKSIDYANIFFNDPKQAVEWDNNTASISVKNIWDDRIFTVKSSGAKHKPNPWEAPTGNMTFTYGDTETFKFVPGVSYKYSIGKVSKLPDSEIKESAWVRVILYDKNWKRLDLTGWEDKKFWITVPAGENKSFIPPANCAIVVEMHTFTLDLDPKTGKSVSSQRYAIWKTNISIADKVVVAEK